MNKQIKNKIGLLVSITLVASYNYLVGATYNYYLCAGDQRDWDQVEWVVVPEGATAGGWVSAETWGESDTGQYAWANIQGPDDLDIYVEAGGGADYQYQSFRNGGAGIYMMEAGQQYSDADNTDTGDVVITLRAIPNIVWDAHKEWNSDTKEWEGGWIIVDVFFGRSIRSSTNYAQEYNAASGAARIYYTE